MKSRAIAELKTKSIVELQKLLAEHTAKLRTLLFDIAAGKAKNGKDSKETRKTIARIHTFIRESRDTKAPTP